MRSSLDHSRFINRALVASSLACLLAVGYLRAAEAIVYAGTPDLALTSAMVAAGGGPEHFSSLRLFKTLTGAASGPEALKLTKQFGAANVRSTFAVFDYAIEDVVRVVTEKHIALPPPSPTTGDARALAVALYSAGTTTTGNWDVGYMLEHLITHPIHHTIMRDIDRKFSARENENFHIVLSQMMDDLKMAYR